VFEDHPKKSHFTTNPKINIVAIFGAKIQIPEKLAIYQQNKNSIKIYM